MNYTPILFSPRRLGHSGLFKRKLEIELIRTQMAHKPVLRAEVYARALRASQSVKRAEVWELEFELELTQTQKAQKPMLRVEVYARALRASQT
jgi:hypothetical protein